MKITSADPPTVDRPPAYVMNSWEGVISPIYSWITSVDSG